MEPIGQVPDGVFLVATLASLLLPLLRRRGRPVEPGP
jgi:hypothetical protein